MKKTTIITAKILAHYAELIEQGVKHYEVRSEPLDGADAILLVSSETGKSLGMYEVRKTQCLTRDEDDRAMGLAKTTPEEFFSLFPKPCDGGPDRLWIAELGNRTTLDSLVGLENEAR